MGYEWFILIAATGLLAHALVRKYRGQWLNLKRTSYAELLDRKNTLHNCVIDWRYPDGSFIPQHKRQALFKELSKLAGQIQRHPDNPANQKPARPR